MALLITYKVIIANVNIDIRVNILRMISDQISKK
jgi:hypothetical protein